MDLVGLWNDRQPSECLDAPAFRFDRNELYQLQSPFGLGGELNRRLWYGDWRAPEGWEMEPFLIRSTADLFVSLGDKVFAAGREIRVWTFEAMQEIHLQRRDNGEALAFYRQDGWCDSNSEDGAVVAEGVTIACLPVPATRQSPGPRSRRSALAG
jgi:hypothetical protein